MAQYYYSSARGRRPSMEDIHITVEDPVSKWIVFAVCDGHGGTAVVKHIEKILAKRVLAALAKASDEAIPGAPIRPSYIRQSMKLLILAIDAEIERELKSDAARNSGCTLNMMAYNPLTRQIVLVNVGDSRSVLSLPNIAKNSPGSSAANANGRKLIETKDHKPGDKLETLRIAAAGSYVARGRVGGILALSRAMGDFSLKGSLRLPYDPVAGAVCALPDVQVGYISPLSAATALLCCDGVWDVMTSEEAVNVAEAALAANQNPAEKLVHTAFQKMSSDNLTCLVVRLHPALRAPK